MKGNKVIVHIVNSKAYSGLENVAFQIINNLKDKYDFYYVTQPGPILEQLKENKIKYYIINKMSVSEIKKMIKKLQPDIIHAHDYTASVICALSTNKIPIINHLHNNSPWLKKICKNSIAYLFAGIKAKKILLVSKSIENEYIFSFTLKNKMVTIGNPVSRNNIISKVSKRKVEKKYDVCCVARMTPQKNIYKFTEVIKDVKKSNKNLRIIWVGTGEQENEFKRLIEENNLKNNITLVGFQKNPYLYMQESKIFLLTSDWEGYGLVAFEALTLGLPCVVSNVGGLPNIVDNFCGKLCNKSNIKEYSSEIIKLLTNEKYYLIKSKNAIEKSYSLDNSNYYFKLIEKEYKEC